MPSFIESCNCKGRAPSGIVSGRHRLRPDITGRLLKDRNVARFVVAPIGYGKTSVAFEKVVWIKGNSPCFLRDLDSGTLGDLIYGANPQVRLVVCDDVPSMGAERTELFTTFIDAMLARGCEVIVTCVPSADTFTAKELDSIILRSSDLMLTDDEIEIEADRGNHQADDGSETAFCRRVPCLFWAEDGASIVASGASHEEIPSDIRRSVFAMVVLGKGTYDDLASVMPYKRVAEVCEYLSRDFPHLGIDAQTHTFESAPIDIATIIKLYIHDQSDFHGAQSEEEAVQTRECLARILLERGMHERACTFMLGCSPKKLGGDWLAEAGWNMLIKGGALSFMKAFSEVGKHASSRKGELAVMCAFAALMLDDRDEIERRCKSILRSSNASMQDKIAASLVQWSASMAYPSYAADGKVLNAGKHITNARNKLSVLSEMAQKGRKDSLSFLELVVEIIEALDVLLQAAMGASHTKQVSDGSTQGSIPTTQDMTARVLQAFQGANEYAASQNEAIPYASRMLILLAATCLSVMREIFPSELTPLASSLRDELISAEGDMDWPAYSAALALESLLETYPYRFDFTLPLTFVATLRKVEYLQSIQKAEYKKFVYDMKEGLLARQVSQASALAKSSAVSSSMRSIAPPVPTLYISVFGGLDVRIGSKTAPPCSFKRRKSQILLVLLAINRGREVTRETIIDVLWPSSSMDAYRKNFYAVWGQLKRTLEVDGSCPYLLRSQTGCRLDYRYVSCDLDEFDELCRALMFGRDDSMLWEDMYARISSSFSEDILCGIPNSDYIDETRERVRTQIVDALISASGRMIQLGEYRGSLWFAREALRRDSTREDAYIALMESQIASNQRGVALETYFACRKYLTEELGIDPSKKVMELYHSIIESEEVF